MHRALAVTGTTLTLTLALAGCSSAPEVAGIDSDALISTCLDGAQAIAQEDDTTVEGTISAITSAADEDDSDETNVHIIFDARDDNQTASPAACTFTVGDGEVREFEVESPESGDMDPAVEGAVERWNDKHAEDWAAGDGPDPVNAPTPESGGGGGEYYG